MVGRFLALKLFYLGASLATIELAQEFDFESENGWRRVGALFSMVPLVPMLNTEELFLDILFDLMEERSVMMFFFPALFDVSKLLQASLSKRLNSPVLSTITFAGGMSPSFSGDICRLWMAVPRLDALVCKVRLGGASYCVRSIILEDLAWFLDALLSFAAGERLDLTAKEVTG